MTSSVALKKNFVFIRNERHTLAVQIVAVKWHGSNALTVTYRTTDGNVAEQVLFREDEVGLSVVEGSLPWSFDADAGMLRLASEAYRINLAHIFDPYLAVHTSAVEPLPHQISAVYQENRLLSKNTLPETADSKRSLVSISKRRPNFR